MTADSGKPSFSYASLIGQAIHQCQDKRARLSTIYQWISANYPYFRPNGGWQNSIRHNLTVNKCFIKDIRPNDPPGKGSFWKINPDFESFFEDGVLKSSIRTGTSSFDENHPESENTDINNSLTAKPYHQTRKLRSDDGKPPVNDYYSPARRNGKAKSTGQERRSSLRRHRSSQSPTDSFIFAGEVESYNLIEDGELGCWSSDNDEQPYWAQQTLRNLMRSPRSVSKLQHPTFFSVFRPVDNLWTQQTSQIPFPPTNFDNLNQYDIVQQHEQIMEL